MKLRIFFLCYSLLLLNTPGLSEFQRGQIIDTVSCIKTPGQSYALYLPTMYNTSKKWPVIFIFEPAARGALPLTHMKKAAEQFGYVLISSNNARNGSWEVVLNAADAMFLDAQDRFNLDTNNFYTSGFSGGSRSALAIAVITGRINGVIACGAGLPSNPAYQPSPLSTFYYFAIVGMRDMNLIEHISLVDTFNGWGIKNHLLTFEAGHEWPGEEEFVKALEWMKLKGALNDLNANNEYVQAYYQKKSNLINRQIELHNYWNAHQMIKQLNADLENKLDLSELRSGIDDNGKEFNTQEKEYRKTLKKENELVSRYLSAFSELYITRLGPSAEKGYDWWSYEINQLRKMSRNNSKSKSDLGFRMINLVSSRSAESSINYTEQGDYELALILNKLWVKTLPDNIYAHWHMAKINSLMKNKQAALDFLEKAHALGMSKPESLEKIEEFEFLRNEQRYQDILTQLKEN